MGPVVGRGTCTRRGVSGAAGRSSATLAVVGVSQHQHAPALFCAACVHARKRAAMRRQATYWKRGMVLFGEIGCGWARYARGRDTVW